MSVSVNRRPPMPVTRPTRRRGYTPTPRRCTVARTTACRRETRGSSANPPSLAPALRGRNPEARVHVASTSLVRFHSLSTLKSSKRFFLFLTHEVCTYAHAVNGPMDRMNGPMSGPMDQMGEWTGNLLWGVSGTLDTPPEAAPDPRVSEPAWSPTCLSSPQSRDEASSCESFAPPRTTARRYSPVVSPPPRYRASCARLETQSYDGARRAAVIRPWTSPHTCSPRKAPRTQTSPRAQPSPDRSPCIRRSCCGKPRGARGPPRRHPLRSTTWWRRSGCIPPRTT